MSLATFIKNADKGYYKQAALIKNEDGDSINPLQYLAEDLKQQHGVYPEAKELADHTDYWISFLQVQPHEHVRREKVKRFAEQNWALETAFADQKVQLRGDEASQVQKAYTTTSTQVLFPFYFETNIVAGILASGVLEQLVAETIAINSHTADHLAIADNAAERSMGTTGEGGTFAQVTIQSNSRRVYLSKTALLLKVTYEAMRLQRLPLLALFLRRVGQQYAIDLTDKAIQALVAGDGAGDGASPTFATASAGNPIYSDLVKTELDFTMGYTPSTIVAPKESIQDLLLMPEFKDPLAGVLHQTRGTYPTPVGKNLVRWDVTGGAASYLTTMIIMMDPSISLVHYTEGGLITDSDRIIDGEWLTESMSSYNGFGRLDHNSVRVGTGW